MGCVYKLTFPNGKVYIGLTIKTFEHRWKKHLNSAKNINVRYPVHHAINKYGAENVFVDILHYSDVCETLKALEIEAIAQAKELGLILYNRTNGGDGALGYVTSEATKLLQSEKARGNKRAVGNTVWVGRKHTEETKKKISDFHKGKQHKLGQKDSAATIAKRISSLRAARTTSKHVKLSYGKVVIIKQLITENVKQTQEIANIFGVSKASINLIKRNKNWPDVPWPDYQPGSD